MKAEILALSAALALTSCQKAPSAPAAADKPAGQASSAPQRRAGLWQQSFSRDGAPAPMGSMKVCIDAARASMITQDTAAKGLDKCGQRSMSRGVDGSYDFTSTCPMPGGGSMVTHGHANGDFASGYHVRLESDVTGAAYGPMNGHHVTEMDGKWLGPCPAGMNGGDMELANGMKISGGKLAGAAEALAHGGQ
jgi:hypothetical protein